MTTTLADRLSSAARGPRDSMPEISVFGATPLVAAPLLMFSRLELAVTDENASRRFYSHYFGLGARPASREDDGSLTLHAGEGFALGLVTVAELPAGVRHGCLGFSSVNPTDVDDLRRRFERDGVPIVRVVDEPERAAVTCRDPDGYEVELRWQSRFAERERTRDAERVARVA